MHGAIPVTCDNGVCRLTCHVMMELIVEPFAIKRVRIVADVLSR
jgi:hypothetical protein